MAVSFDSVLVQGRLATVSEKGTALAGKEPEQQQEVLVPPRA